MASSEKVLSLFEPHTRAIPRHKGGAQVEFGRLVMLDEEGGIVTRYQILEHPTEHGQAMEEWPLIILPTWWQAIVGCIQRLAMAAETTGVWKFFSHLWKNPMVSGRERD